MPSLSEPFGLVALEALARGTPAIISRTSGVGEVLPARPPRGLRRRRGARREDPVGPRAARAARLADRGGNGGGRPALVARRRRALRGDLRRARRGGGRAVAQSPRHDAGPSPDLRRLGARAAVGRQRDHARPHADLRPLDRGEPVDAARRVGRVGRSAGGSHGQLRGRAPDAGSGPHGAAGPAPRGPRAPRRVVLRERGPDRRGRARPQAGSGAAPDGPRLRRRRPLAPPAPGGTDRAREPRRSRAASACTSSPTAATPRRSPRAGFVERLEEALRPGRRPHRDGVGPLLRDGPRQAMGPRRARVRGARVLLRPARAGRRAPPSTPPTRGARPTSSSSRP